MRFFFKRTAVWVVYLVLTVLFFSIPIILRDHNEVSSDSPAAVGFINQDKIFFDFADGSAERETSADSVSIRIVAVTDSSQKAVYLYVNGEKQDMAVVSDSMGIEFPRVYLKDGDNDITAVLLSAEGDTLALRKKRIVSLKKL